MAERPPTRHETPDELPRFVTADPLMSMRRRTPGPRGLLGRIALAAVGLMVLFALTALIWAAVETSHREGSVPPNPMYQAR